MDMQHKKGRSSKNNIKATLKATATATAVIALNAGIASAAICPPNIISSATGAICTFSTGQSVTISNGGSILAIDMSSYSPTSSFILVESGGVISGANTGIKLATSTLTGSISSSGLIQGNSTGIFLTNSSAGGISNNGTVTAGNAGIDVTNNSTIQGGYFQ